MIIRDPVYARFRVAGKHTEFGMNTRMHRQVSICPKNREDGIVGNSRVKRAVGLAEIRSNVPAVSKSIDYVNE